MKYYPGWAAINKRIMLGIWLLTLLLASILCNGNELTDTTKKEAQRVLSITEHLLAFYPLQPDAAYTVTICADLPDNNNPEKVYKKKEPGHVFLILTKQSASYENIITASFGFYPRVPVTCLFKKVRSRIMDNSNREYNASLEKKLTMKEFVLVMDKCKELSKKKYDLKKFNCYEYALEVFNSLPGIEKLPVSNVRFPFILGRGGSPCGLYRDLKNLVSGGSSWTPFIRFGLFRSPFDRAVTIASIKP